MEKKKSSHLTRAIALAVVPALIVSAACFFRTSAPTVPRPATWAERVPSQHLKNFFKLDEGVFRSKQPGRAGFEELRDLGFRTVLNLRSRHTDEDETAGSGLALVWVPMKTGKFKEADVVAALRAIRDAAKPVLVHCQAGADRAGVISAMYRVVFQGWSKEEAIAELRGGGFGFHSRYKNIPEFIREADIEKVRRAVGLPPTDGQGRLPQDIRKAGFAGRRRGYFTFTSALASTIPEESAISP